MCESSWGREAGRHSGRGPLYSEVSLRAFVRVRAGGREGQTQWRMGW